jgi:hypothetical protein
MKINQIIGVCLILAGITFTCFWLESADKSTADWRIDALGLWVGKFRFKKSEDGGRR